MFTYLVTHYCGGGSGTYIYIVKADNIEDVKTILKEENILITSRTTRFENITDKKFIVAGEFDNPDYEG